MDDEPNVRSSIKLFLEDKYYVIEAESGKEVLNLLEKVRIDLILLDIHLEDMNGIQVLQEIKKNDIVRKISKAFDVNIDSVNRVLPAGGVTVIETVRIDL